MDGLRLLQEDHVKVKKMLSENLEHHIQEEEEDMFEKARRALRDEELADLGERVAARRDTLEATK